MEYFPETEEKLYYIPYQDVQIIPEPGAIYFVIKGKYFNFFGQVWHLKVISVRRVNFPPNT